MARGGELRIVEWLQGAEGETTRPASALPPSGGDHGAEMGVQLPNISRTTIEHLSNNDRTPIEHLSNMLFRCSLDFPACFVHVPPMLLRLSLEFRCIFIRCSVDVPRIFLCYSPLASLDLPWNFIGSSLMPVRFPSIFIGCYSDVPSVSQDVFLGFSLDFRWFGFPDSFVNRISRGCSLDVIFIFLGCSLSL